MNTIQKIKNLNWLKINQLIQKEFEKQKQEPNNFIKIVELKGEKIVVHLHHNWGIVKYNIPFNCSVYVTLKGSIFNKK